MKPGEGVTRRRAARVASAVVFAALCLFGVQRAYAEGVTPAAASLPTVLSLDEALRMFRRHGLDLLIADAATRSAEGSVQSAGAIPNPTLSAGVGNAFTFSDTRYSTTNCLQNGARCSPWTYNVGLSDSAAIEDTLSGKRDLRLKVARNALAAAKMSRTDAERVIAFQVKVAYLQLAQATLTYKFAKDISDSNVTTLNKFKDRYQLGAINIGDLQRIETQKLESDQARDLALQALRQARVALAFLLGARGEVPDFDVDTRVLEFSISQTLRDATAMGLLHTAFEHRPDLASLGYQLASAEARLALTMRQKFPDITVGVNYAWGGFGGVSTNGPLQSPTLSFSVSAPIPVLYQLQGEQRQAEAQRDTNTLQYAKVTSQVVNDVSMGLAGFVTARRLVERMEGPRRDDGGLLESAKGAFEVTATQYEKGAANLTDYLDALRTYIATRTEYFGDLTNYWTSVYQLELAVATDLR